MGHANFEQSQVAPKLRFRIAPEDKSPTIRVKVEMNTAETTAYEPPIENPFEVKNPWFTGRADIPTFARKRRLQLSFARFCNATRAVTLSIFPMPKPRSAISTLARSWHV